MSYILLTVALTLSSVAAFYSIVGLAAIFSGAYIPVIIMGTTLEMAKVLTTLWLHNNWKTAPILLKTYLTSAVVVLMIITSLGIFGFLSKAHVAQEQQQTFLQLDENSTNKQLNQLDTQIEGTKASIEQLSSNSHFDEIKKRIDAEQLQLNTLQAQKQEQQLKANQAVIVAKSEIATAQQLYSARKISELQNTLGLNPDGKYGSSTKLAYEKYIADRQSILSANTDSIIDTQIEQAQERITNLQNQLTSPEETKKTIAELQQKLSEYNTARLGIADHLAEVQKKRAEFEVEIGPITFISELFFNDDTQASSRNTVRMLIFTIIAVFDPLAILLVLAASSTIVSKTEEPVDDSLPTINRLRTLLEVKNGVLHWRERDDKAFNSRWANKPVGAQVTIDGKRYKTKAIMSKMTSPTSS